jgi:hypothetical protein
MSRLFRTQPSTAGSRASLDARALHEGLREEYRFFCDDIKRDLDPIEAEYGGCPTFQEWLADREHDRPLCEFPKIANHGDLS